MLRRVLASRIGRECVARRPLMTAAFLDDDGAPGSYAATVTDGRYRAPHMAVVEWIRQLQEAWNLNKGIDAEDLGLALSNTTLGIRARQGTWDRPPGGQLEGGAARDGVPRGGARSWSALVPRVRAMAKRSVPIYTYMYTFCVQGRRWRCPL